MHIYVGAARAGTGWCSVALEKAFGKHLLHRLGCEHANGIGISFFFFTINEKVAD